MRDLFHGGTMTFNNESFIVFGSKMSSNLGQNARQGKSKRTSGNGDKLDFSEMLSNESIRLAGIARA